MSRVMLEQNLGDARGRDMFKVYLTCQNSLREVSETITVADIARVSIQFTWHRQCHLMI